jgi:hypothetical protein
MPDEERAEGLDFIGKPAQPVDLEGAGAAGNLHDALIEGHLPSSAGAAFMTPSRPTIAVSIIMPTSKSTTREIAPE